MKSSDFSSKAPHLLSLLLSVCIAVGMWYVVSVRDRLEAQLDVSLDYYGIPGDLVITEGLVNKVVIRLRGPETLLRSMTQRKLIQAVDLSHIKKGTTSVPLTGEALGPALRAFELIDVQPPRLVIKADTLLERTVPVRAKVESPLRTGALAVENVSVTPDTILLRGPESAIAEISSIPLTIMLDPKSAGTTMNQTIPLDTPSLVTPIPSSVKVQYTITSGRTVVSRRCKIEISTEERRLYAVTPEEITVLVEVPDALATNARYLGQLEISIVPPPLQPGESRNAPLRFRLPEGMTLLNPTLKEVKVTQKTPLPQGKTD